MGSLFSCCCKEFFSPFFHFLMFSLPIASCLFISFHENLGLHSFSLSRSLSLSHSLSLYFDQAFRLRKHCIWCTFIPVCCYYTVLTTWQNKKQPRGERGGVVIVTDWFAKCKQSAVVQGEERACPQSVINLSNHSWCMSYISTLTCKTPKS